MKKRGRSSSLVLFDFQKEGVDIVTNALTHAVIPDSKNNMFQPKAFLLYDEMGLGKTIQSYKIIKKMSFTGLPVLIVAPSACIDIWSQNEYYKDDFDIRLFLKNGANSKTMQNLKENTIIITSYETLNNMFKYYIADKIDQGALSNEELVKYCQINDKNIDRLNCLSGSDYRRELFEISRKIERKPGKSHLVCSSFMKQKWGVYLLDEIHKIRNPSSDITKAVAFVDAVYRLGLSGTPIVNGGADLLSIWKYGLNLFNLDWDTIKHKPESKYCKQIIDTISLGRKKEDLPELLAILPKRNRKDEHVIISWDDQVQKEVYITTKNASLLYYKEYTSIIKEPGESNIDFNRRRRSMQQSFMGKMQSLRQICLHKDLPLYMKGKKDEKKTKSEWNPAVHNSFSNWTKRCIFTLLCCLCHFKIPSARIKDMIKEFVLKDSQTIQPSPKMVKVYDQLGTDGKMIVFSTFKVFLKQIMQPWLTQIGLDSLLFCGGSRLDQQKALKEFSRDPNVRILLIVKSAGSEGLNIQFDANKCVIMDPHFNLAMDEQAAQRIDRIGQTKDEVIIRKLYMEGSIDEALKLMQTEKQNEIEAWNSGNGTRSLQIQGLFLEKRDRVK